MDANAWYAKAVTYAYEHQLFNGTGGTNFSPNAPMTRAMFVQVLANKTENYSKGDWTGKSSFSDVKADSWYAAPVEWAAKAGLVNGVGNGEFAPEKNVTRQEMAVILYHYAQKTGNDTSFENTALDGFSDASAVSSWAREAMTWAATHGVINGSEGKLNPQSNAKRCEVAQVTVNAEVVLVKVTVSVETEVENEPEPEPTPNPTPSPTPAPSPAPTSGNLTVTASLVFSDGTHTKTYTVPEGSNTGFIGFHTPHTYVTNDWYGYLEVKATGTGPFRLMIGDVLIDSSTDGILRDTEHLIPSYLLETYKKEGGGGEYRWKVWDGAGNCVGIATTIRFFGREDTFDGLDGSTPDPNYDWGD